MNAVKPERLQWHPAFYAGIQIELKEDAANLIFENEHQLTRKPLGIDVLVTKKEEQYPVTKNIGRIFRKYNVIEYKGATDYLSVDDFYKAQAYVYLHKSDTTHSDSIKIEEMTLTLVSRICPRKLFSHLKNHGHQIQFIEEGICYVTGDAFPIQIIVTDKLSRKENLWLRSLTDRLPDDGSAQQLLTEYNKHKDNNLYEAIMDLIVCANKERFRKGDDEMCEALMEIINEQMDDLMKYKISKVKADAEESGQRRGEAIGQQRGEVIGQQRGEAIGQQRGENKVNSLIVKLSSLGRNDDILRAATDNVFRQQLYQEFEL